MALTDNILAYWNLNNNGSGGVSLVDSTGQSNTLTNNGGVALGAGKIGNGSAVFNGSNDLSLSAFPISSGNFAISLWAKTTSSDIGVSIGSFNYPDSGGWRLYSQNSDLIYAIVDDHGYSYTGLGSPTNINDGDWHHLVVTYDGTNSLIYLDGVQVQSLATTFTSFAGFPFGIGYDGQSLYSDAQNDEVGLWSRAISSSEVLYLYNSGSGRPYPFELYYNNATNNGNWGNLNNWWKDSAFTFQATSLPDFTTPVFIYGDVLENTAGDGVCRCNGAEFHSASFYYPLVLNSNGGVVNCFGTSGVFDGHCNDGISFHDSCSLGENGYVGGDAVFRDQSTNSRGYVNGNAIFHEQSYNYGTINGNATVYYDNNQGTYPIGGTVNGTVSYLGWPAVTVQYFNDQASGGGDDGDWTNLNNWWADDAFTTRPINAEGTQELPDAGTDVYIHSNVSVHTTGHTVNNIEINWGGIGYGSITCNQVTINDSGYSEDTYIYNSTFYTNNGVICKNNGAVYFCVVYGGAEFSGRMLLQGSSIYGGQVLIHAGANLYGGNINLNSIGVPIVTPASSGGGTGGFLSRLLRLPWFINI